MNMTAGDGMGTILTAGPHNILAAAMPRLLAASYATAILAAVIIRVAFRRRRSHLSYRSATRGQHELSRRR